MNFLLALLSVSSVLSAQNLSQMGPLASDFMPQGVPYSLLNFSHMGATAYAVASGGEIYGIFWPNQASSGYFLSDSGSIADALRSYYLSQGYSPDALSSLSAVHAGINRTQVAHKRGEAKCRQQTGTDALPCNSYETCRTACLGTPFCPNFAAGGKPGEFIHYLLDFENNSAALSLAYENEGAAYLAVAEKASQYNALAYLSSLGSLNKAATRASQSPLYDAYQYCATPDYALASITGLQLIAQRAYQNASKFYSLGGEAVKVANRTVAGIVLMEGRKAAREAEAALQNASANASADAPVGLPANLTGGQNASAPSPQGAPSSPLPNPSLPGVMFFAAGALAIAAIAGLTAFAVMRKKRGKGR